MGTSQTLQEWIKINTRGGFLYNTTFLKPFPEIIPSITTIVFSKSLKEKGQKTAAQSMDQVRPVIVKRGDEHKLKLVYLYIRNYHPAIYLRQILQAPRPPLPHSLWTNIPLQRQIPNMYRSPKVIQSLNRDHPRPRPQDQVSEL